MAYIIDSSSLIEAKDRTFCFDICPGYWDWLIEQNTNGAVYSIDKIYDELIKGNDELVTWCKRNAANFFLPIDDVTIVEMIRISSWAVSSYPLPAHHAFMSGADPFLIAHALAHKDIVVTDEILNLGEKKRIKIPAACREFNVKCMTPVEMLRIEGVRFVLERSPKLNISNLP